MAASGGAEQDIPMVELPLNSDGECMRCHKYPESLDCLSCCSCASPWHLSCLLTPVGDTPADKWSCPDCSFPTEAVGGRVPSAAPRYTEDSLASKVRAIEADPNLSLEAKARQRQELFSTPGAGASAAKVSPVKKGGKSAKQKTVNLEEGDKGATNGQSNATLDMLDERMNCMFCLQLVDRPVTTPCGHNFCLKCFQKWVGQGKKTCAKCRAAIPPKMASQPRINSTLVVAIRLAKAATSGPRSEAAKHYHHIANSERPTKAFTTARAVKSGKANACSGRIFVTVPPDHFGPITADYDPERNQGVLVGETWEDRMECRQWGAHFPHVAGIAGQSDHGAQSVALSGGYEDDMDMGEYFLYTGSGGRDLSGNKRTNKEHSFDQKFDSANEALRLSCKKGYPVRVVRSHKEKRSSYAPESGVRYDGVYRIDMCWRKKGAGGYLVCRYLFVRCDNEPAPWTTDEDGDRPRELPHIPELKGAKDITQRAGRPAWDWKTEESMWGWTCPEPSSKKMGGGSANPAAAKRKQATVQQRLLKEFGCKLCGKVLEQPVSTQCGHNFCKVCLENRFGNELTVRNRSTASGRSLRVQKVPKPCPASRCGGDIADLLLNLKVNLEMVDIIETLKLNAAKEKDVAEDVEEGGADEEERANPSDNADQEEDGRDKALRQGLSKRQRAEQMGTLNTEGPEKADSVMEEAGKPGQSAAGAILLDDDEVPSTSQVAADDGGSTAAEGVPTGEAAAVEPRQTEVPVTLAAGKPEDPAVLARGESLKQLREKFPDFDEVVISQTLDDEEGDIHGALATLKQLKRHEAKARREAIAKAG